MYAADTVIKRNTQMALANANNGNLDLVFGLASFSFSMAGLSGCRPIGKMIALLVPASASAYYDKL